MRNLGNLLDRSRDPDKIALVDFADVPGRSGEAPREFRFRDIDDMANAVARGLLRAGFGAGARIAILSANRAEYLTAFFGILRAGLIAVPVNFRLPPAAIDHVLADCGAQVALCDVDNLARVPARIRRIAFDAAGADGFDSLLDPGAFETVRPAPDDIAMFLYTSGSSGPPKGVKLSHAGQIWTVDARLKAGRDLDRHRLLVAAPLYHMNGLLISLFAHAAHATEALLPRFAAKAYIEAAERCRCTWLTSVPTMLALALRERAALDAADLSAVQIVSYGSAPVTQDFVDALRAQFPRAALTNGYGTTESGAVCFGAHPDGLPRPPIALGYPLPGVTVRLVDGAGRAGDRGVLHIRSPALMAGYHGLPEKTAEVLTGDGFYVTGDVMRRDENGFYYFVGRADDMFVCGGENIYPLRIEGMLVRHRDIDQACVVPVADPVRGQMPVAFVVCRPGAALAEDDVKAFALANATPQEHPRRVFFLAALPLAGTGKIDRAALAARAREMVG